MSPQRIECKAQALKLPPTDRAVLVRNLIASLDEPNDDQNENLWLKEAERRYQEYKRGNLSARPAADVLRHARATIQ